MTGYECLNARFSENLSRKALASTRGHASPEKFRKITKHPHFNVNLDKNHHKTRFRSAYRTKIVLHNIPNSKKSEKSLISLVNQAISRAMSLGPAQKAELIDAIYTKFGVPAAAAHCHLAIREVLDAIDEDDQFAQAVERAVEHLTPLGEQELFRRAVHGVDNVVVNQGRVVMITDREGMHRPLIEKKYSDSLLIKFLEARKRSTYGPKVEIAHKHEGFIAVPVMDSRQLQALMDAPGDEVTFLDAEYEVITDTRPLAVAENEIEADYNGLDRSSEADHEVNGSDPLNADESDWDIL